MRRSLARTALAAALASLLAACGPGLVYPGDLPGACAGVGVRPAAKLVVTLTDVQGQKRAGVEVTAFRSPVSASAFRALSCAVSFDGAAKVGAVTNADGVATLPNLMAGSVRVQADGASADLTVEPGETKTLALETKMR